MLIKRKKIDKFKSLSPHQSEVKKPVLDKSYLEAIKKAEEEIKKAKADALKIKKEAEEIIIESQKKLQVAEEQALNIIESAQNEAEELKQRTYEAVISKANSEAEIIKNQSKLVLKKLFEVKREVLLQAHKEIVAIAIDLAEKILRHQASIDTNVLKTQVLESIKKATKDAERVQVYVNAGDKAILEEAIPDIEKLFPAGLEIIALVNESVEKGSCIVETKSGQLDARFSTQLKSLIGIVSNIELPEPQINLETNIDVEPEIITNEELSTQPDSLQEEQQAKIQSAASLFSIHLQGGGTADTQAEDQLEKLGFKKFEVSQPSQEAKATTTEESIDLAEIEEIKEINSLEEYKKQVIENEENQDYEKILKEELLNDEYTSEEIEVIEPPVENSLFKESIYEEEVEAEEAPEEEELIYEEEEDETEEEKPVDIRSILKKKTNSSQNGISSIAKEIEGSNEFRDLLED